jgi:hypothetical protein
MVLRSALEAIMAGLKKKKPEDLKSPGFKNVIT